MGRYAEYAERLVADWPPLTEEQQAVIRLTLAGHPAEAVEDHRPVTADRERDAA